MIFVKKLFLSGGGFTLTSGSVIGLKEEITEPVKIYANGSFIATGEIVVIDQNFAVRVKSINKN